MNKTDLQVQEIIEQWKTLETRTVPAMVLTNAYPELIQRLKKTFDEDNSAYRYLDFTNFNGSVEDIRSLLNEESNKKDTVIVMPKEDELISGRMVFGDSIHSPIVDSVIEFVGRLGKSQRVMIIIQSEEEVEFFKAHPLSWSRMKHINVSSLCNGVIAAEDARSLAHEGSEKIWSRWHSSLEKNTITTINYKTIPFSEVLDNLIRFAAKKGGRKVEVEFDVVLTAVGMYKAYDYEGNKALDNFFAESASSRESNLEKAMKSFCKWLDNQLDGYCLSYNLRQSPDDSYIIVSW